jgi:hypothetical protein
MADEGPRREVLAGPALHVLGVPLQEALVGVALHVGRHREPVLLADQFHDELPELGRVLDLVLGLLEDDPEHPALRAEGGQGVAVMLLELDPLHLRDGQVGPAVALGDGRLLAGEGGALAGHLEEEEEGELLQVVLVGEAVVAQDVAVGPELLDDPIGGVGHASAPTRVTCPGRVFSRAWSSAGTIGTRSSRVFVMATRTTTANPAVATLC